MRFLLSPMAALLLAALPAMADEPVSTVKVTAGGATTSGNSRTEHANLALNLSHRAGAWRHELNSEFLHQTDKTAEDDSSSNTQKFEVEETSRRSLDSNLFLFGTVWYEQDRNSGYRYNSEIAFGFGRDFAPSQGITARAEVGPGFYRAEEVGTSETRDTLIVRFATEGKIVWGASSLTEKLTVTTGDRYTTARSSTTLSAPVAGRLSLEASLKVVHYDVAVTGKEPTDTTVTMGLAYSF